MQYENQGQDNRAFSTRQQAAEPQHSEIPTMNWFATQGRMGQGIAWASAGQAIKKFVSSVEKALEAQQTNYQLEMIHIDRMVYPDLPISAVAIACIDPESGLAGFYTCMLEVTADPISSQLVNEVGTGNAYEVFVTTSSHYTQAFVDKVHQIVAAQLQLDENLVFHTHGVVVYKSFNLEDESAVVRIIDNAMKAIVVAVNVRRNDFIDIRMDAPGATSMPMRVQLDVCDEPVVDPLGLPSRSDWKVTLVVEGQQHQLTKQRPSRTLTETTGYVDMIYDPRNQSMGGGNIYSQQLQKQTLLSPMVVIKQLDAPSDILSPSMMLLALANAYTLTDSNANWTAMFNPLLIKNASHKARRDIGAIGIIANPDNNPSGVGTRVLTDPVNMPKHLFGKFMLDYVSPDTVIAFDVDDCAAFTWQYKMLAMAGFGGVNSDDAKELLIAANVLTGGKFEQRYKEFGGRNEPVLGTSIRMHTGFYFDKDGNKRDIADFDLLAILNRLGETNIQAVHNWINSFNTNDDRQMFVRKQILDNLENITYTGQSRRYIIEPAFMQALVQSLADCRYCPAVKVPFDGDNSTQLQAASWHTGGLMSAVGRAQFGTSGGGMAGGTSGIAGAFVR